MLISLIIIASLIGSCNLPVSAPLLPGEIAEVSVNLVTPNPNATATPTPFQPVVVAENTQSPTSPADGTATPDPTPEPTEAEPTTPPWVKAPGQVDILLLGSDQRQDAGFRTDVILWISLNPSTDKVVVVSFPRDLWVYIPGWQMNRINSAHQLGFGVTQAMFEYNFGIRPDHYVLANFDGFRAIINTLGGVDIYAAQNLTDRCDPPLSTTGYCSVGPGYVHMDASLALWYVRSRYSSSDIDRLRRAQEVLQGIFLKLMSLDAINRADELYALFSYSVQSDMTLADMLPLLPLAAKVRDTNLVRQYSIGWAEVTPWINEEGSQVLLPNMDAVNALLQQSLFAP